MENTAHKQSRVVEFVSALRSFNATASTEAERLRLINEGIELIGSSTFDLEFALDYAIGEQAGTLTQTDFFIELEKVILEPALLREFRRSVERRSDHGAARPHIARNPGRTQRELDRVHAQRGQEILKDLIAVLQRAQETTSDAAVMATEAAAKEPVSGSSPFGTIAEFNEQLLVS